MINVPVDILKKIIETLIHEYASTWPRESDSTTFLPRWYLTPLLWVCKIWYIIAEEYLYCFVSVGSKFPHRHEGRLGKKIAIDLLTILKSNCRLAALVKALRLGTEGSNSIESAEWTQTNIRILRLCPNLEHVEIRGFRSSNLGTLIDVLKTKSLISFHISLRNLSMYRVPGGNSVQIFDMMRAWPKLRKFQAKDFLGNARKGKSVVFDPAEALKYYAELQEIVFTGAILYNKDFRALRAMCSGVTKLNVPLNGGQIDSRDAALDGLCECLCAWSATLKYVKLHIRAYRSLYRPLSEALSALRGLRELQFVCTTLDFRSIADLPLLERLLCGSPCNPQQLNNIAKYLENQENFPSLGLLVYVRLGSREMVFSPQLEHLCLIRNIQFLGSREALSSFVM